MKNLSANNPLPRSEPEEQGLPSRAILSFLDFLEGVDFQVHSLILLCHGHVIAEAWWRPYEATCRRYLYSLSKSFTSTAVGFAIQEGLLDVHQKVISFFQDHLPSKISANLEAMRLKDLLTMSTGHAIDTTMMILPERQGNWAQAILSAPVDFPPGTHFLYNSGATYLLSCIVQQVSRQSVLDYLTPRLFEPLGISGMTWETCPRGINTGGWGLSLTTEDLAKFGQFYLQKGSWDGRQLLSAAWIADASSAQVRADPEEREKEPSDWGQGYGYQFWRCQNNAYRGDGAFGQYCIVMPDQDAVLAITSQTPDMQKVLDRVWKHLLLEMTAYPLPPDPRTRAILHSRLASLEIHLGPGYSPSGAINGFFGRRFSLQENFLGLQAISISFGQDASIFHLWDASSEFQLVFGDRTWKCSETWLPLMQPTMMALLLGLSGRSPLKVAAFGQWRDAETFTISLQYLETPHTTTITFKFQGDELHLDVTSSMARLSDLPLPGAEMSFVGVLQPSILRLDGAVSR